MANVTISPIMSGDIGILSQLNPMEVLDMDIRVIALTPGYGLIQIPSNAGSYSHVSVDEAKKAAAAYVGGQNKANFTNGYDIMVVDVEGRKLASWAGQPKPSLTWADSSST